MSSQEISLENVASIIDDINKKITYVLDARYISKRSYFLNLKVVKDKSGEEYSIADTIKENLDNGKLIDFFKNMLDDQNVIPIDDDIFKYVNKELIKLEI